MLVRLHHLWQRCWRDERAVALIEFAIVFPFLFVLLFGAVELGRNILISERVEKAGYVLSDIASQYPPATGARVAGELNAQEIQDSVFGQMRTIMGIYYSDSRQRLILTAIRREGTQPRIQWQITGGGSLSEGVTSVVNGLAAGAIGPGVRGTVASFANDSEAAALLQQMAPGEMLLVGEVFYRYEPILTNLLQGVTQATPYVQTFFFNPRTIAKRMFFRPRNGDLICLPPDFLYDECQQAPTTRGNTCSCVYSSSQRVTNCNTRVTLASDYFRCGDGTTRTPGPTTVATSPTSGCGGFIYGSGIENYTNAALNGACVNP